MSDTQEASVCSIKKVVNMPCWFRVHKRQANGASFYRNVYMVGISEGQDAAQGSVMVRVPMSSSDESNNLIDILHHFYDLKIGEVGCYWGSSRTWREAGRYRDLIEFRYANIKFGDLFDFYTSADGVRRLPNWKHIKHAMDEYLAEDPRLKFHPSRVQQFIDENGVEKLEIMD